MTWVQRNERHFVLQDANGRRRGEVAQVIGPYFVAYTYGMEVGKFLGADEAMRAVDRVRERRQRALEVERYAKSRNARGEP